MPHITETALDNVLVHQKDKIIYLINKGDILEAIGILNVVRELWESCGYSYKRREIIQRAIQDIQTRLDFSYSANDAKAKLHWKKRESLESLQSQLRYALEH